MNTITSIEKQVYQTISAKLPDIISDELHSFLQEDVEEKVKKLKLVLNSNNSDTCFDRLFRIIELAKFISFWTKDIDISSIELMAKINEITATTYLTKIAPELRDFLSLSYSKINNYPQKICDAFQNKNMNIWHVIHISSAIDDVMIDFLLNKKDCDNKIAEIIKDIVDAEIKIPLILLIHKSITLFKRRKDMKRIENEIFISFKNIFVKNYNIKDFVFGNKNFNLVSIYQKNILVNKYPDKFLNIQNLYKKLNDLKKVKMSPTILMRSKVDRELKKEFRTFKILVKKNKTNKEEIVELMSDFSKIVMDYLSKNKMNRSRISFLLKVKQVFNKIL
jgi:hypothetical protein